MTRRGMASVAALALVAVSLAGCPAEPSSSGASGTVVKRTSKEARNGPRYYEITIKEDGGRRDTGRVTKGVYKACQVGDSWPECKR